jgi:hypothetical protein
MSQETFDKCDMGVFSHVTIVELNCPYCGMRIRIPKMKELINFEKESEHYREQFHQALRKIHELENLLRKLT